MVAASNHHKFALYCVTSQLICNEPVMPRTTGRQQHRMSQPQTQSPTGKELCISLTHPLHAEWHIRPSKSCVSPSYWSSNSKNEWQALITGGLLPRPVARESSLSYCKKELDLCSRGCQPELLVVLQLNAATGFVFHCNLSLSTLSCRSDRSCTLHASYLGRRCFKSLQFCWETMLWLIFSWAPGRSPPARYHC